ncbi:dihydrodipicolinate synthase family protein [Zafaria sp. J156]|uniref:dihydrodipicolinate synthase family protein n=1 Tax=Zafaria sp. J156 TaxID=3116490 RepID=UPI002E788A31|nr:dihydrodipicolinate synthase family protein [Zafaria sp. J156]MEE1622296.1 dihydrodipicolinate synthase family protein [Zafaria sp. J156]
MTAFRGLIAYPVTPFAEDGSVNHAELERHVDSLARSGVDGITLLGSSGSFAYLDPAERRAVIARGTAAARGADPALPVYAGVSAVSTTELLRHAEDAAAAGVDGLLVSTVSYVPLNDDEVANQCRLVASAVDLPICLYSNPGTTAYAFPLGVSAELSRVPGIAALKESAADTAGFRERYDRLRGLRAGSPEDFSHGMSGDALIAEAGFAADAWHSGPASLLPHHFAALRRAVVAGDAAGTGRLHAELSPLLHAFTGLRKLSNLYALARATGVDAGEPRLPLLPIPGSSQRELSRLIDTLAEPL